ncbi:uncharacterized protein LOC115751024 [Rhodamnia argentea]|uniref:Uncharacterized protein LOC115751024 n=1 Tax=Rhodamnia argentea TaxID=178133 RepID=A0A8B8QED2_9MYRT|nr:uncharacterized protein LOC115751024 [Rhodamnia argentea]
MKTHLAVHLLLLMLLISQTEGKTRKLLTATTPTTMAPNSMEETTQGGSEANPRLKGKRSNGGQLGGGKENFAVNSSSSSEHYPDIMDIAGMDYTPAKRKPPIHN